MPYLLDTNILSETIKPKPEARVLAWLSAQVPSELFLASLTIGELMRGARKIKEKQRRDRFEKWIEKDLTQQFENRVLPFDGMAAKIWGRLMGDGDRRGRTPSAADAQIAAVAIDHGLTLVTRNLKDFEQFDVKILSPWEGKDEV